MNSTYYLWSIIFLVLSDFPLSANIVYTVYPNNDIEETNMLMGDSCLTALELPLFETPCMGAPTTADLTFAQPSLATNLPIDACASDYDVKDLWFKVTVPASGNLLIRHNSLDGVETLVEVLEGDCLDGLTSLLCDTLYQEANLLFLINQNVGATLYLRVWDAVNDDFGEIQLSAHELPLDFNETIICNGPAGSGPRRPKDFVIQYKPNATQGEIQDVRAELLAFGDVQLIDTCDCTSPKLELWQVNNPIDLEDRAKGTKRKTAVDTVNYNFVIQKDDPFIGTGDFEDYNIVPPPPPPSEVKTIKVAIIDSGIEEAHPLLNESIWDDLNSNGCVGNDPEGIGYDFKNKDFIPDDIDKHGTAVNGIVVLRKPIDIELEMINGKFYQDGNGDLFHAVCAIHYAVEYDAKVINLSWGFKNPTLPSILEEALLVAESQDAILTTSAGNTHEDNDQVNKWPANADVNNLITVAAFELDTLTGDTSLAPYSNYGLNEVHLAAMGYAYTTVTNDTIGLRAGTSIAAPFVAQTAAIIRARYPNLDFMEVKDCILNSVKPVAVLQDSILTGGVLNQEAALNCANAKAGICTDTLNLKLTETLDKTYQVSDKITSSSTLEGGSNIVYNAAIMIFLKPGFQALSGSNFTGQIEPCPMAMPFLAEEVPTENLNQPISLSPVNKSKPFFRLYPNPANNLITIEYELIVPEDYSIQLINTNGQVIKNWFLGENIEGKQQINMEIAGLNPGLYFLQLQTSKHSIIKKLVIKR